MRGATRRQIFVKDKGLAVSTFYSMCQPVLDSTHGLVFQGQAPTLAQGFGSWAFPQSVDSLEMEAIQTFTLTPLSLSNLCAQYLWDHFQFKLNAYLSDSIGVATMPPFLPLMLLIPLTSELDCIALTLVDAFLNHRESICETLSMSYSQI
jgi:hypothetical protein